MQVQLAVKLGGTALAACLPDRSALDIGRLHLSQAREGDQTRWDDNRMIVVPLDKSYRELRGTVKMGEGEVVEKFAGGDFRQR